MKILKKSESKYVSYQTNQIKILKNIDVNFQNNIEKIWSNHLSDKTQIKIS